MVIFKLSPFAIARGSELYKTLIKFLSLYEIY